MGFPAQSILLFLTIPLAPFPSATSGNPVTLAEADQRSLGKLTFRTAHPVLTMAQKLVVRKLFTAAGLKYSPGDEASAASKFVSWLKELTVSAGGQAPAPEPPKPPLLAELEGLQGNDLLFRLFEEQAGLSVSVTNWQKTAQQIARRSPAFETAIQLLQHSVHAALPGMDKCQADLDAVRTHRSLLDEPDPVAPVLQAVSTALRNALRDAHQH